MNKENCNKLLQEGGIGYPRTCKECGLGPCKHETPENQGKRPLKSLSKGDYEILKKMGFLWEFYPQASGIWENDCSPPKTAEEKLKEIKRLVENLMDFHVGHDEYEKEAHNNSVLKIRYILRDHA